MQYVMSKATGPQQVVVVTRKKVSNIHIFLFELAGAVLFGSTYSSFKVSARFCV